MGERCRSGEISGEAMGVPGGTAGLGVEVGGGAFVDNYSNIPKFCLKKN